MPVTLKAQSNTIRHHGMTDNIWLYTWATPIPYQR